MRTKSCPLPVAVSRCLLLTCALAGSQPDAALAASVPVHGRVEDATGHPLRDAVVRLYSLVGSYRAAELQLGGNFPPPATAEVKTDAEGIFRLDAPAPGVWRVVASAPGKALRETLLRPLVEETWLVTVALPADAPLEVRVVDAGGAPIAGARLLAMATTTSWRNAWYPVASQLATDAQGITLVHRGSGERVDVSVAAPGLALVKTKDVAGSSLRVVLPKGSPRVLTVSGPQGRPVAGALVMAASSGLPLARSGPGGRAQVAVVGSEPLALEVEDGDGATASLTLLPPSPNEKPRPLPVRLERAIALSGRVIDVESRQPLAGAVVFAPTRPEAAALTDGGGAYTLERVGARGGGWLQAAAGGYFPGSLDLSEPASYGGRAPTFALAPAGRITGTVSDPRGRPLAGVEVTSAPAPEGPRFTFRRMMGPDFGAQQTRSDDRGRFRLSPLPTEMPNRVTFRHPGYAPRVELVPPAPAERPAELHVTLSRGARGVGRVVTTAGAPVAGAKATLEREDEASSPMRRILIQGQGQKSATEAISDASGRFTFTELPPARFVLRVEAAGFAPTSAPGIEVPQVESPPAGKEGARSAASDVDLGTVKLAPGAVVEGRVVGPRGEPIEGAEVFIVEGMMAMAPMRWAIGGKEAKATSAVDGAFRVADRTPGQKVDLAVRRSGYTVGGVRGVVAPTEEPVTVTLQPASDVRGRVVDEDGKPVAGAQVTLMVERKGGGMAFQIPAGSAPTGDDGRFLVEGVEPGTVRLTVNAAHFLPFERSGVEVPAGRNIDGLEVVLRPGATVEGVVTAPDGRVAIGATVEIVPDGASGDMFARFSMGGDSETDGDGHYRLDGVEPGPRTLAATHEDYDRGVASLEVRAGENRLDLRLGGGQEVGGRVVGPGGQVVAGATVRVTTPGMGWGFERSDTTDSAGLFSVSGVPDGTYDTIASHPEYAEGRGSPVTVAGAPVLGVTIELPTGGAIVGALQGLSQAELPQTRVTAFQEGKMAWKQGTVSYDGRYRIAGLAPGEWTVIGRVEEGGRQAHGRATVAAGGGDETLDLDFKGGLVVSGHVRHAGKPVDGAMVMLQGQDVPSSANARTDFAGAYRAENLEPGSYRLEVFAPQSGLRHEERLAIDDDREVDVELRSLRLAGTVLESGSGDPIAGAVVQLEPLEPDEAERGPRLRDSNTTDDDGRFALGAPGDGGWRLTARKSGYGQGEATVQAAGQPVEGIEIRLQPTQGLTLHIARTAGSPPAEIHAAVLDGAGRSVVNGSFATGENGSVRLSSVPAGNWEVLVRSDDSGTVRVAATSPGPPVGVVLAPQATLTIVVPELSGSTALVPVVLAGPDGRPFQYPEWGGLVSTLRLHNGQAMVPHLPAGTWTIRATASDGKSWQGTATTTAGASTTVELR